MSHVIPLEKVNQFLPNQKLELDLTDVGGVAADHGLVDDLEETARDIVVGRLSTVYDTSTWAPLAYPSLVTNIMGLLVAGWVYDRQFSEEVADGGSYGTRRVKEAYSLLDGLIGGLYAIEDLVITDDTSGLPVGLESDPVFEMGSAF